MFSNEFPLGWSLAGLGLSALLLAALFFLRIRSRERVVPGVMLYREALAPLLRRRLGGVFSRWRHFLFLLLLLTLAALAVSEPILARRNVVIVASPEGLSAALQYAEGREVILAGVSPVRVRRAAAAEPGAPNRGLALDLASASSGEILYFGAEPPPYSFPRMRHVRAGNPLVVKEAPLRVRVAEDWKALFSGLDNVVVSEAPEVTLQGVGESLLPELDLAYLRHRPPGDAGQISRCEETGGVRGWGLAPWLLSFAFLLLLIDARLYRRGRVS